MTNVSYDIYMNNQKVKNVTTYAEAVASVKELGGRGTFKTVYTSFNPEDTAEKREYAHSHAQKVHEALKRKAGVKKH